jgi:hypothetical protein
MLLFIFILGLILGSHLCQAAPVADSYGNWDDDWDDDDWDSDDSMYAPDLDE